MGKLLNILPVSDLRQDTDYVLRIFGKKTPAARKA